jgi:hypothetical protein
VTTIGFEVQHIALRFRVQPPLPSRESVVLLRFRQLHPPLPPGELVYFFQLKLNDDAAWIFNQQLLGNKNNEKKKVNGRLFCDKKG